jgi:hypothetical protein
LGGRTSSHCSRLNIPHEKSVVRGLNGRFSKTATHPIDPERSYGYRRAGRQPPHPKPPFIAPHPGLVPTQFGERLPTMPLLPRLHGHTVSRPGHRSGHPCQPPRPAPRKRSATAPTKHAWGAARPSVAVYRRRRSERTLLYRTVQNHLATWLAMRDDGTGCCVPGVTEREFRHYLECGILDHGFARARCADYGQDFMIVDSCKGHGVCPSCTTRHMVEAAAHFALHVIPRLPVRQWVLSVPKRLRYHGSEGGGGYPFPHPYPCVST